MQKGYKDAFKVEELRDKYARTPDLIRFKKTYSPKLPEIKNLNTPKLWDRLNNIRHINSKDDPMTWHKIGTIAATIPNDGSKVLNIGCGAGDLENYVLKKQKKNLQWVGVDISPKSLKECRENFKNAKFELGDILKLKYKDESFDIVILSEIMEHISPKNTFRALKEVNRVLRRGGRLVVSIPVNEGLPEMVKRGENPNAHVRAYTKSIVMTELALSGFLVMDPVELYAFRNFYWPKTWAMRLLPGLKNPNNLVLVSRKIN